ncbi:Signal recognition particle associated protein [Fructilactobacillus florum 8D]|uniref:UPF0122 protein B808_975 n=2 Tax=Fructilactobacillus florum TaxID=640331 RepID=W9EDK3_9LACO|nr:putative DNA-binding protein [Fructilactobacillus florum]EKK20820.1 Signal recognition particle associated protein [Fructilactobacillus florum 2F]ETO40208.1 Signal recognition particle associated protein [Fructilactobacillus florum 8D]KRM91775.1 hypothetical protein FC87_GL000599 [Fructilactobacillus florum DSM 22689 = JCM 16035]
MNSEQFDVKLAKDNRINALYEFYGPLLTAKQAAYVSQYYADDLSLGEISENFAVSRQAVYDNLRRTEQTLEDYETKMHLYAKFQARSQILDQLQREIDVDSTVSSRVIPLIKQLEKIDEE